MYVEISGRQTGKTTRLIEGIIEYLDNTEKTTACIVASSHSSRSSIQERVLEINPNYRGRIVSSHKMFPGEHKTMKFFVDEFLFMHPDNLIITESAYYISSSQGGLIEGEFHKDLMDRYDFYRDNHIEDFTPSASLTRFKFI